MFVRERGPTMYNANEYIPITNAFFPPFSARAMRLLAVILAFWVADKWRMCFATSLSSCCMAVRIVFPMYRAEGKEGF